MVVNMNHVESPPEQRIPLNSANQGNGHLNMGPDNERPGRDGWNAFRSMLKSKKTAILKAVIIIMVLFLLSLVIYNFVQHDENKRLRAEVQRLQEYNNCIPKLCPKGWISFNQSCFSFSDTEATWNLAYNNCQSSGGELLVMATPEERAFIEKKKEPQEYWIGFQRENEGEPWKHPDGSFFDNRFVIEGNGLCAFLDKGGVRSTNCNSTRFHWICRKTH